MFPIQILKKGQSMIKDSIAYIVGKNGFFIKKQNFIGYGTFKTSEISHLKPLTETMIWNLPLIPNQLLCKAVSFFSEVNREFDSKAIILILLDEKNNQYSLMVPRQKVSRNSVEITDNLQKIDQVTPIVGMFHNNSTIHSLRNSVLLIDGLHVFINNADNFPKFKFYLVKNEKEVEITSREILDKPIFNEIDTSQWLSNVSKGTTKYMDNYYFNYNY